MKYVLNFIKLISNRQLKKLLWSKKSQIIKYVLFGNLNRIKKVKIITNEKG